MNKYKKILMIFACLLITVAMLSSCGNTNSIPKESENNIETGENIVLSQRQKEILEEQGLPTEYDRLTALQQNAINAIEDMLVYLEKKYDDSFLYKGYYPSEFGQDEHITATCSAGTVTVYRNGMPDSYAYTDNYEALLASPVYKKALEEYFSAIVGADSVLVFTDVSEVDNSVENTEAIVSRACAASHIFIDESIGDDAFATVVMQYSEWIVERANSNSSTVRFYFVKSGMLEQIDSSNYDKKRLEDIVIDSATCVVTKDGDINVF